MDSEPLGLRLSGRVRSLLRLEDEAPFLVEIDTAPALLDRRRVVYVALEYVIVGSGIGPCRVGGVNPEYTTELSKKELPVAFLICSRLFPVVYKFFYGH
jgi:hypothetical protein